MADRVSSKEVKTMEEFYHPDTALDEATHTSNMQFSLYKANLFQECPPKIYKEKQCECCSISVRK